jgi:hypothetical protein
VVAGGSRSWWLAALDRGGWRLSIVVAGGSRSWWLAALDNWLQQHLSMWFDVSTRERRWSN